MGHKYSSDEYEGESDKGLAIGGGAGYGFPIGGMQGFVEGKYMHGMFSEEVRRRQRRLLHRLLRRHCWGILPLG